MLLAERMGLEAFRDRVKIHATDVDDDALTEARHATYTFRQVADVPEDLRAKYFDQGGDRFSVKRELRRRVIFGHHDLLQDAPLARVDLLLCRNTLMYFNTDAQGRIMARFYYSIRPGGYLILGCAEMLSTHAALFQAVDVKRRIFKNAETLRLRDRRLRLAAAGGRQERVPQPADTGARLGELAFENCRDPRIVVDGAGVLVGVAFAPLAGDAGAQLGTRVAFTDVTSTKTRHDDRLQSKPELETADEQLRSTNEDLQSTVEELETTNEELQWTNEELETINEQLQSANEELQTMNGELERAAGDQRQGARTALPGQGRPAVAERSGDRRPDPGHGR